MKTEVRSIVDKHGRKLQATVILCQCGADTWLWYTVKGHTHWHAQCTDCGASYCPEGACRPKHRTFNFQLSTFN